MTPRFDEPFTGITTTQEISVVQKQVEADQSNDKKIEQPTTMVEQQKEFNDVSFQDKDEVKDKQQEREESSVTVEKVDKKMQESENVVIGTGRKCVDEVIDLIEDDEVIDVLEDQVSEDTPSNIEQNAVVEKTESQTPLEGNQNQNSFKAGDEDEHSQNLPSIIDNENQVKFTDEKLAGADVSADATTVLKPEVN